MKKIYARQEKYIFLMREIEIAKLIDSVFKMYDKPPPSFLSLLVLHGDTLSRMRD